MKGGEGEATKGEGKQRDRQAMYGDLAGLIGHDSQKFLLLCIIVECMRGYTNKYKRYISYIIRIYPPDVCVEFHVDEKNA